MSAPDHQKLLKDLLRAPRMTAADILKVDKVQGVYVWWLVDPPTTCLKVGRAFLGARQEGLRRRIRQHLSSHIDNTVLARHLAADKSSPWCAGFTFKNRDDRKRFLATRRSFQFLTLPDLTQDQVDEFEELVEMELRPRYIDYVRA